MAYDGPVSRVLNRRLSRPLARLAAHARLSPNAVTAISTGIACTVPLLFLAGKPRLAGIAIQAASVADGIDGDLARLTNTSSQFGAVLDAVTDRYADAAIIAGMTYWAHRTGRRAVAVPLGCAAMVGSLMVSYARARVEVEMGGSYEPGGWGYLSRDVRLLIAATGSALGRVYPTLLALAVMTNGSVIWRLARLHRQGK